MRLARLVSCRHSGDLDRGSGGCLPHDRCCCKTLQPIMEHIRLDRHLSSFQIGPWTLARASLHQITALIGSQSRSAFKEGSLRGEIMQRTRTERDKSQENTATPFFGISPKTTLVLSVTSIDSRQVIALRPALAPKSVSAA